MASEKITLRLQKYITYLLIGTAAILFLFALGFMTNFYELYLGGNSEMFDYYKRIQSLNTVIFDTSLYLIVLAILHLPFDFHKKSVSIFGLILSGFTFGINLSNALVVNRVNTRFARLHLGIDFSGLENYDASLLPFQLTQIIVAVTVVVTLSLFVLSVVNFISERRK